ncbi:hypothetical protein MIC97_16575 [Aquamicrobium sp. NLF2-7]|uniref:hypothetical protein n=1 Tax=Aquamicrobium sp. NLF2-7 TaxID=2918753 RepID=UPI001EFB0D9B|nr:hypothetical protein [Aquamicrobium sp. NLF2-7]MCG8273115.1 hypothetical protein [Aquamicrobium sp. NLF2-7]
MELALGAIAKVGGLLGIGGGGAAAGATSAGLGGASTLLSALQAVGTIAGGLAAAGASKDMAAQTELQAGQEKVESTQRQTQMKRTLLQVLGENDVTFAAAGIDISGGIAQQARQTANRRAADELTIDRRDSDFRRAMLKMRSQGYRRQANSQIGGALLSAAGGLISTGLNNAGRGGASLSSGAVDPWAGMRIA